LVHLLRQAASVQALGQIKAGFTRAAAAEPLWAGGMDGLERFTKSIAGDGAPARVAA
jgi:hypothetical protein